MDENLTQISNHFDVNISRRGSDFKISGHNAQIASDCLEYFAAKSVEREINLEDIVKSDLIVLIRPAQKCSAGDPNLFLVLPGLSRSFSSVLNDSCPHLYLQYDCDG